MKYSIHDYAKALEDAMADPKANKDAIVKNFLALVRRNGDEGRTAKILDEAVRFARSRSREGVGGKEVAREVVIESARALGKAQEKMVHQFIKAGDVVNYKVNPDLVAGIKITVNDEMQFDGTMKAKLDTLFV